MNKFNVGDAVIYTAGDRAFLGIIKEVLVLNNEYAYRVWYHSGDTSALSYEDNLFKIENEYCYTIIRHSANKEIQYSHARIIAAKILSEFNFSADMYYKLEDWITDIIEQRNTPVPKGIESEYLCCALRVEVEDLLNSKDMKDIKSEDIEECVNRIINHNSINVLDMDFISDIVDDYIEEMTNEGEPISMMSFNNILGGKDNE